ncbi:DNA repair protein RecO [Candidatus Saccharibacteria bacterium]|nr:MAG: DNA repair protein RecO [Candidatus Saccharibacteria bacterium]
MKQVVVVGIVLARTNYGEADRILTVLTRDHGKVRLVAKGVRKIKSKMAGGIELFSVNDLTYTAGKGDLGTLISSRLKRNYGNIVTDIQRTMYAYEVLKSFHKITEDAAEPEYFDLLNLCLQALDEAVPIQNIEVWLAVHLLSIGGHTPDLAHDTQGQALAESKCYMFDVEHMTFAQKDQGAYQSQHIKLLRLALRASSPQKLSLVQVAQPVGTSVNALCRQMLRLHGYHA